MLGRLLHLGSGTGATQPQNQQSTMSRPVSSLESVQEDMHTRNLLFPDAQALFQHRNDQFFPLSMTPATPSTSTNPGAFDSSDDIDIDVRDVRVIMMQDTLGPTNATLLFDSHPGPAQSPTSSERPPLANQDVRRTPTSSRKGSLTQLSRPLSIQSDSPRPRQGAFDRRGSLHGRSQSYAETESQRVAREYREELATFSSCIFGNSELMAYKGTSTKVHVVPSETRIGDHASSVLGDGRSSIGRSSARTSKLSQSFSSQNISPTSMPSTVPSSRHVDRKKVLITRLFPVNISNDDLDPNITPQSRFSDDNAGFPFPTSGDDFGGTKTKKGQPKQRRTPMYAVVLVIQLPSPRPYQAATPRSAYRESGSYNDQDFFSSSYSSAKPSIMSMGGSGLYGDLTDSTYAIDVEDRIDSLTQHWDIIMRTLTHLQSAVATTLKHMLIQADVGSPEPFSPHAATSRNQAAADRRSVEIPRPKPTKSSFRLLSLGASCLSDDANISTEVNAARSRIVTGLKAARVVTGQGRWGIWRDEAIWTAKWAQTLSQDQGQFFYQVLTGFLGTHTDWLQALCPPSYRRRLAQNKKARQEEDMSLTARTIIVSDNKMAARRLIFLLSAFLPANQHHLSANRAHRPSISASVSGFSNSPPTYVVPVLREESLRRKINRRTGTRRASHSRTTSQSTKATAIPSQLAHLSMDRAHERRVSDASSIRTTSIVLTSNDFARKSSAATTATIVPETTTAHFSTIQQTDNRRRPRPSSSGSVATDDLKRSLKRGESSGHVSTISTDSRSQGSRWGSVISGLWSPRRRESTSMSSSGFPIDPKSPVKSNIGRDKLAEMVRESSVFDGPGTMAFDPVAGRARAVDVESRRDSTQRERPSFSLADRTPDPTGAFESPVKTSINEDDGVIDVDVPFPDYITSFESAISSPSSSGYLSTPGLNGGLDLFEYSARISIDGDLPLNAAGWLARFHPDFALQAIPPQDDLLEQVKATLRSEPNPPPMGSPSRAESSERWIDAGSVIIADTTTCSVKRIVYKRLVKARQIVEKSIGGSMPGQSSALPATPSIIPYETPLDEEWTEEIIFKADNGLVEAMEKVINLNPMELTRDSSAATSQTCSEIYDGSDGARTESTSEQTQHPKASVEMPRVQCKTLVLSALEDIIREVIDTRERQEIGNRTITKGYRGESLIHEAVHDWASNFDIGE